MVFKKKVIYEFQILICADYEFNFKFFFFATISFFEFLKYKK